MKRLLSLGLAALLALTLAACGGDTAAPSSETPKTPETAAVQTTAATAETADRSFFTVGRHWGYNTYFNNGDALYEVQERPGYCLVVRTDFATATQQVVCQKPGCTHDSEACPAWLPGQYFWYQIFLVGDTVYVYSNTPQSDVFSVSWEEFYAANVRDNQKDPGVLESMGMTEEEYLNYMHGIYDQQTAPAHLYVLPEEGTSRQEITLSPDVDYNLSFDWCDGAALYGCEGAMTSGGRCVGYRVDLADGTVTTFPLMLQEIIQGVWGDRLLTTRLITDVPLPDANDNDMEANQSVLQNARAECDWLDPVNGERGKVADMPRELFFGNGNLLGNLTDGRLYFMQWETQPDGSAGNHAFRMLDANTGRWQDILAPLPSRTFYLNDLTVAGAPGIDAQEGRYLWGGDNEDVMNPILYVLDQETGTLAQPALDVQQTLTQAETECLALTDDGRFLLCVGQQKQGQDYTYDYGLIDAEAFLQGSTDYTPVTMVSNGNVLG